MQLWVFKLNVFVFLFVIKVISCSKHVSSFLREKVSKQSRILIDVLKLKNGYKLKFYFFYSDSSQILSES